MAAREILHGMGLDPYPVTSGSKGIHLYAALDGRASTRPGVRGRARAGQGTRAGPARPGAVVDEPGRADRARSSSTGRRTTATRPRSPRTRCAGASGRRSRRPAPGRSSTRRGLAAADAGRGPRTPAGPRGPPAPGRRRRRSPSGATGPRPLGQRPDRSARTTPSSPRDDRLAAYRAKRDASKTPEPVPQDAPTVRKDGTPTFVIQEHHATRDHYDFRLEHDGVLVSWALPKGEPTDPGKNHLAVHDRGPPARVRRPSRARSRTDEYGGGTVTIWDDGTYELEKWREGEEVIVTLHGRTDGAAGSRSCTPAAVGGRGRREELADPPHEGATRRRRTAAVAGAGGRATGGRPSRRRTAAQHARAAPHQRRRDADTPRPNAGRCRRRSPRASPGWTRRTGRSR